MEDIANVLAYQIKQEIAQRYFGFRKQIETDSASYIARLEEARLNGVDAVKINFQRMQCLLATESLYRSFLKTIGLQDPERGDLTAYRPGSRWRDIGKGLKGEGFTRKRRYSNLVFSIYRQLSESVANYRNTYTELDEEHEYISLEIQRFYRNNDLTGILGFLRRMDNPDGTFFDTLQAETSGRASRSFEQDLRIYPPPPVSDLLQELPEMEPLKTAKAFLKPLIDKAYPFVRDNSTSDLPI